MIPWIIFFFGLFWGSFLNVVSLKWGDFKSIVRGRSACSHCQKTLSYFQLLPVVSFLVQRGKCRYCGGNISLRYPIVEITTGLILYLLYQATIGWINFIFVGIAFSILLVVSLYDLKTLIIPDRLVWSFNILTFLGIWLARPYPLNSVDHILSGLALFSFFALLWFVSRGAWMGFGDAKLALGIGFLLGPHSGLLALVLSFCIGTISALLLMFLKKDKYSMKSQIPFGPFLALGAFVSFVWGSKIIEWYLR